MGRMFDALARGKKPTQMPEESALPTITLVSPEPIVQNGDALPEDDDSVPHIEVGGPRPKFSAANPSPSQTIVPPKSEFPRLAETPNFISVLYYPVPSLLKPTVAEHPFAKDLVAFHQPDHVSAHHYRALMKECVSHLPEPHRGVLLFTSVTAQSGTTTTVLNLAILRAKESGQRVLVLDANAARPDVPWKLGVPSSPGIHDLLHGHIPLALTIHRTALSNLSVLTCGHGEGSRGEMDRTRLTMVMDQLRLRFDWILIDTSPWGDDSLPTWISLSDSVYLIIRQQECDSPKVDTAHEGIQQAGGCLRGYVTTR